MAAQTQQPRTQVTATLKVGANGAKTKQDVEKAIGRPLGSPINGKQEGDEFDVTLTGNIEIREFQGQKGAYFTTKEGYSIRVNASFDPAVHKENAVLKAVCRVYTPELTAKEIAAGVKPRVIKFAQFAD